MLCVALAPSPAIAKGMAEKEGRVGRVRGTWRMAKTREIILGSRFMLDTAGGWPRHEIGGLIEQGQFTTVGLA